MCIFDIYIKKMSFNLYPTHSQNIKLLDCRKDYKEIVEQFCKVYYAIYDNDFVNLSNVYIPDALFSYLEENMVGFEQYVDKIRSNGIRKFLHHKVSVTSQPINKKTLVITSVGHISVNDSTILNRFSETIILQRSDYNNKMYITNTIFKLID